MSKTNRRGFLQQATAVGLAAACGLASADVKPQTKRLRVVTLEGSPSERGLSHGKTLKDPIHALVKAWKDDLAQRYRMPADAFIKKFLQHTNYLPAMKKWTPELIEEIRGISRGADLDFDTMLVFQLIDEYWIYGPGVAGEHCSALGIGRKGDRPSHVAQNMDLEGFRDGFQTVLHIKDTDSKLETLVLTHAGLIALNGMNNRALGVCCNTLGQLAHCRDGLPVACVVRGVLRQKTEADALKFLRDVKHASGQNYILGGPDKVHDLECSAGKVSPFTPKEWPSGVWHTNHPLSNDDYTPQYRELLDKKKDLEKAQENSTARLQSLKQRLGKDTDVPTLKLIQATLTARDSLAHPVCRSYKNKKDVCTFAATIMVLSDKPELLVAPGTPDVHPYQTLSFT